MPLSLSGSRLDDPKALRCDLLRQNLPVGEWAEKCNSFVSPCEREPGTAHLLIRRSEWDRIADKTSLTLTFIDHTGLRLSLVKLHPVSAPTPLAQEYNPRNPVLWLMLEDRRSRYRQVYVGRGYNLRLADGSWDTPTLNSGTPWTWAQVVADLWAKIRAVYTDLPSSPPSLPATPSGTPESFYFFSKDAWTALCDVCQAAGLLVKYDPTTDTTSIINPAGAAPAEPNVAKMTRTWDTGSGLLIPEAVPATVYVSYPRIGRSDYHQASAAITESGTTTGAAVVLGAYPAAAGDPVSNTTYLNAFAGRVRDFWRRDLAARSEPRRVQYRGHQSWVRQAVGLSGFAAWSVAELAGGEVQTCLYSGPLMRLSTGEPLPEPASASTAHSYLLDVPCLVFSGGVAVGLAGVVVTGDGSSAECVVKGACEGEGCGGGSVPPSPPPPVTATISGTVYEAGSGDPIVGREITLAFLGEPDVTTTTDVSGNYSFSGVEGPSLQTVIVDDNGLGGAHSVDGGAWTYGAAASVMVTTTAHDCDFVVGADPSATINVTVQNVIGSAPLSGRTVTVGAEVLTTNMSGQASFAGVAVGSTAVVLTLAGGESASWAVDVPGASGKGNTATFTTTSGGTHGVTFQVNGVTSGGGE